MSDLYAQSVSFKFEFPAKESHERMTKEGKFLFIYSVVSQEPDGCGFPDRGWVYAKDEVDARSKFSERFTILKLEQAQIKA